MTDTLRIVQYMDLVTISADYYSSKSKDYNLEKTSDLEKSTSNKVITHLYQNYYVTSDSVTKNNKKYGFLPFQMQGGVSSTTGENTVIRMLLPNNPVAVKLLEKGNGNRLSRLTLTTAWIDAKGTEGNSIVERYVGIGSSFSETTIELRFRSAMDSVGTKFPSRVLSRELVGELPVSADLALQ